MNIRELKKLWLDSGFSQEEAEIVLCEILGVSRAELYWGNDVPVSIGQLAKFAKVLKKRKRGQPIETIFCKSWFLGKEFYVNKHVLKPRQDSECVVVRALEACCKNRQMGRARVLDLCCGSGNLGLVLAQELERHGVMVDLTLSDISKKALYVAKKNAKKLGVDCKIIKSDLFKKVEWQFDLIVCNPPYIRSDEIDGLDVEVKKHDPRLALDGGKNGLEFYVRIEKQLDKFLKSGGQAVFEIGFDQREAVEKIFRHWNVEICKDLCENDRVLRVKRWE